MRVELETCRLSSIRRPSLAQDTQTDCYVCDKCSSAAQTGGSVDELQHKYATAKQRLADCVTLLHEYEQVCAPPP
jgi:hypothetical protein